MLVRPTPEVPRRSWLAWAAFLVVLYTAVGIVGWRRTLIPGEIRPLIMAGLAKVRFFVTAVLGIMDHVLHRCSVCLPGEIRPWFRTEFGRIGRGSVCGRVLRADGLDRQGHEVLHQSSNLRKSSYAERSSLCCDDLSFYSYSRFRDLGL